MFPQPTPRFPSLLVITLFALFAPIIACAEEPPAPKPSSNGIFVAVGYGGRRMSSRDGITWEHVQQWADKGADDSNNLISVVYGKGKFVAVGGGGWSRDTQAGHVLVSTDGAEWREVKKMPFRISPILFDGSRFIAGAPNHQVIWSDDGETWTDGAKAELPKEIPGWAFWFRHAAATKGNFVFVGNADPKQKTWWCLSTHDGTSVVSFATDLPPVNSLQYGGGKFLLVSADALYTSTDGVKWTKGESSPKDTFRDALWTGKEFFLNGKTATYTSPDGITWKPFGKPAPCNLLWSDGSLFLGTGWPGRMFHSTDGLKWERTEPAQPAMGINQVAYGALAAGK